MPETLSLKQLNRATLARQMLLEREAVGVVEAVERLAGLQAQEARPPFVGLWTRVEGFEADDLRRAIDQREVVRATLMRATLHLMSSNDYALLRAPLQPAMQAAMSAIKSRSQGLDVAKVLPAARGLLEDGPQTFKAVRASLEQLFPKVNDRALGYTVRLQLPLVIVPSEEDRWGFPRVPEFTLAEGWLGTPISSDASPETLVERYLAAFGPASVADVQTWSGVKGMKGVLDGMRDGLAVFADENGRELFDLPDAPRPDEEVPAPPRFLPEFDNLVLAHAERARVLADEHRPAVVTKNLRVNATFLRDGFVGGTWKAERKKDTATLALDPFAKLSKKAFGELSREGEAMLRFLEPDATTLAVTLSKP